MVATRGGSQLGAEKASKKVLEREDLLLVEMKLEAGQVPR
jgi:hypothetical protein